MKKDNAITLISLIITIVILIILAGIAVATLTGENGIFGRAKEAKIEQLKAEAKEAINKAILEIEMEEIPEGKTITLQSLHDKLSIKEEKIEVDSYAEGATELTGIYTSNSGISLSFIINKDFDIVIEGIAGEGATGFGVTVSDITASGLRLTSNENLTDYSEFTYIAETSATNQIKYEHITATTYQITGLTAGTQYRVYMIAYDNAGNERKSKVKTITTVSMPDADAIRNGAIAFSSETWLNGKASVIISTNTSFKIEYQVNSTTGTWTTAPTAGTSVTVGNLNHGDIVYARLTDGTGNTTGNAEANIADTGDPDATITFASTQVQPNVTITATVTLSDSESGIDTSYGVKWVLTNSNTSLGTTDDTLYNGGTVTSFNNNVATVSTTSSSTTGDYYLHILFKDNADRIVEKVSNKLKVSNLPGGFAVITSNGIELPENFDVSMYSGDRPLGYYCFDKDLSTYLSIKNRDSYVLFDDSARR